MISVAVELGRGHAAHARDHRAEQHRIAEREQRADLERIRAGTRDHQHAEEADQQHAPAGRADLLVQEIGRGERREDRRGEHDRGRAGERHQAESDQQHRLRGGLRAGAHRMRAEPPRAIDREARGRQHEARDRDQRHAGADEQHLADRVDRDQPFRGRARGGEDHARDDHVEDRERDVLLARRDSLLAASRGTGAQRLAPVRSGAVLATVEPARSKGAPSKDIPEHAGGRMPCMVHSLMLIPAALITGSHFARSAFSMFASSVGVDPSTNSARSSSLRSRRRIGERRHGVGMHLGDDLGRRASPA